MNTREQPNRMPPPANVGGPADPPDGRDDRAAGDTEVLVLNGSPGSGKSTLANAISELLRQMDAAHAVIDVDELARVYPETDPSLKWRNLAAVWPNYCGLPKLRVLLPVVIDSASDLRALREATPCARFTICELTAATPVLSRRITAREPNEFWRTKLRALVEGYAMRDTASKFADFQVRTDRGSVDTTARRILRRLGWRAAAPELGVLPGC